MNKKVVLFLAFIVSVSVFNVYAMDQAAVKKGDGYNDGYKGKTIKVNCFNMSMNKVITKKQKANYCVVLSFMFCTGVLWAVHHYLYQAVHVHGN